MRQLRGYSLRPEHAPKVYRSVCDRVAHPELQQERRKQKEQIPEMPNAGHPYSSRRSCTRVEVG